SAEILQEANDLVVIRDQAAAAETYYMMFCEICASMVFVVLGFAVLYFLNTWLLLFLLGLVVSQFVLSALVMSGPDNVNPGPFRRFIQENLGSYLSVLSSLNFLTGFLVILAPFM